MVEDVEVDRGVKQTLPLVIGIANSKDTSYGMVGLVNAALIFSQRIIRRCWCMQFQLRLVHQ